MSESDFQSVAAIVRNIAQRLSGSDVREPESIDGLLELLKAMLLVCPRAKDIRPLVVDFAQALAAYLSGTGGKVSPITPSVAAAQKAAILAHAAALAGELESQARAHLDR